MAARSTRSKRCPSCVDQRGILPLSAFGKNSNNPDGHATYCKECNNTKQRDWKAANADKVRTWNKAYIVKMKRRNEQREPRRER